MNTQRFSLRLLATLLCVWIGARTVWADETTYTDDNNVSWQKWDGTITKDENNQFAKNGIELQDNTQPNSEANPYLITTARGFAYFARIVQKEWTGISASYYWKLAVNIDLDNRSWASMVNADKGFKGHFDGGGHVVKNLSASVTANNNFALISAIKGTASASAEFKNLKIQDVAFTASASRGNATRIAALVGNVQYAKISDIEVSNVRVDYGSYTVNGNNYVGAVAGYGDVGTVLTNIKVDGVTVVVTEGGESQTVNGLRFGGVIGGLVGAGSLLSDCDVKNVTANLTGKTTTVHIGGAVGYIKNGSTDNALRVEDARVQTVTVTHTGPNSGSTYTGGLIGYAESSSAGSGYNSLIQRNSTEDFTVTQSGNVNSTYYAGGLIGGINTGADICYNRVSRPKFKLSGSIYNACCIGGGIGHLGNYTNVDGLSVSGVEITGSDTTAYIKGGQTVYMGGAIGRQAAVTVNVSNLYINSAVRNVAADGVTILMGNYRPVGLTTSIGSLQMGLGGVIGFCTTPFTDNGGRTSCPEHLVSNNVKIYAPYASVSPTVATFAGAASIDNYDGVIAASSDMQDLSKRYAWLYGNFTLGLSRTALDAATSTELTYPKQLNFDENSLTADASDNNLQWLAVNDGTFKKRNRHYDYELNSRTVLYWTNSQSTDFATPVSDIDNTTSLYEQNLFPVFGNTADTTAYKEGKYQYYPYYYQGVNYGRYADDIADIVAGIEAYSTSASTPQLTLTDQNKGQRGFGQHTFEVSGGEEKWSYMWYVDGKKVTSQSVTPSVTPEWREGRSVVVNAVSDGKVVASAQYTLPVAVLSTRNSLSTDASVSGTEYAGMAQADRGTSENPYIIDCKEALWQWSMLSAAPITLRWEGTENSQSSAHYNLAYFELGGDIDLSPTLTEAEKQSNPTLFTPISRASLSSVNDGTWSTYNQNHIFNGHFDGKGHKISNFRIVWYGGAYRGNNAFQNFGFFGAIGNSTATAKWGDDATGNCVVQNLILENAQMVHKTDNATFIYNETNSNGNHVSVGVLAGVMGKNTTVRNVEVRNSKITDQGSSDYSIGDRLFSVGGMVGRMQSAYATENGVLDNTVNLQLVSADCDIDLSHATFRTANNSNQRKFTVGGIVGSIRTSQADTYINWPEYAFYSGKVNAPNAFVAPVFASAEYNGNNNSYYSDYCKHYMAKASASAMRTFDGLYYRGYQIHTGTAYQEVTEDYPADTCTYGARTVADHSAHSDYGAYYYQGVNYGSYADDGNLGNIEDLFAAKQAAQSDSDELKAYHFVFTDDGKLYLQDAEAFHISLSDANYGDASKEHVLQLNNSKGDEGYTYVWYDNEVQQTSVTGNTYTVTPGATPHFVYVQVYGGSDASDASNLLKTTVLVDVPRMSETMTASFTPTWATEFDENNTVTVSLDDPFSVDDGNFDYNYAWTQWYEATTTTYTAQECYTANKDYIEKVVKTSDGSEVAGSDWSADIYENQSDYTVTYKKVETIITETDYNNLSEDERDGWTKQTDGTYLRETTYVPVTTSTTKVTTVGKSDLATGTSATNNVLTGAAAKTTYYCVISATDKTWQNLLTSGAYKETYQKYQSRYATKFNVSLQVRVKNTATYVYLDPTGGKGSDDNDGLSSDKPVLTWKKAYSLLDGSEDATWDENYIVLMSKFTSPDKGSTSGDPGLSPIGTYDKSLTMENTTGTYAQWQSDSISYGLGKNVTITGKDYKNGGTLFTDAEYVLKNGRRLGLFGDTRFEYMTFSSTHAGYEIIMCQYHSLEMGEGLKMKDFKNAQTYGQVGGCNAPAFQIFGGFNNDARFTGNPLKHQDYENSLPKEGFKISIKSGLFSIICTGGRQTMNNQGIQGTPRVPIKCTIEVDVDRTWNDGLVDGTSNSDKIVNGVDNSKTNIPYDVTLILAGNHEGAQYGDVTIRVLSGKVGRLVNGTMGAVRSMSFTNAGTSYKYPMNAFMGRSSIEIKPQGSRFYTVDESTATTNARVLFTELYGGSLGRAHANTSMISVPFYGQNSVSISGGTMAIPAGVKADNIICGIYGGGAGGVNGIGIDDARNSENAGYAVNNCFPYWADSESEGIVLYGDWKTFEKATGENKLYITCHDDKGNKSDIIDPQYAKCTIDITGGVFGSESSPITGIFGGGSGFTSVEFLSDNNSSCPNEKSGVMYGKPGDVAASLTISGNPVIYGSVYGAGRGTDKYYTYSTTDWASLAGRDYSKLALTYGDVRTTITGGTIYGDVFAGAAGVANADTPDMARVYGNTSLTVGGTAVITGNIYGGGESAKTDENTNVTVNSGATIGKSDNTGGHIYGGGLGHISGDDKISADVDGDTHVTVNAGMIYGGSVTTTPYYIYGGGNLVSKVGGTANVTLNSCLAKNQVTVYGAGNGANTECANTNVWIRSASSASASAASSDYGLSAVYGGGNEGTVSGLTSVNLVGGRVYGDVFGGGNKGVVGTVLASRPEGADPDSYGTSVSLVNEKSANPVVYGDIFGGGNLATVYGNTAVTISSGQIAGQIFGGGNGSLADDGSVASSADVTGNTAVTVDGVDAIWNKRWDDASKQFTSGIYIDNHNIFGGGNAACAVGGKATVTVLRGMTPFSLLKTDEWKNQYNENTNPHFYVFGGGYGVHTTVDSTDVTIDIEGEYGEYAAEVDDPVIQKAPVATANANNGNMPMFDNTKGIPNFTVLGALGGGYAGSVNTDTKVTVDGNTFLHRIYGGGYGSTDSETSGQVGGNTYVYINGANIYGDVFGGGAGVAPTLSDGVYTDHEEVARVKGRTYVEIADDASVYGSVYGGGDIASVGAASTYAAGETPNHEKYTTLPASISAVDASTGEWSYTADPATYNTCINLVGGDVYGEVYGGGKGLTSAEAGAYRKIGRVEGNTLVHVAATQNASTTYAYKLSTDGSEVVPYMWGNVYGGCAYGIVAGNTLVHIEDGMLGRNIIGGGYGAADGTTSADVLGSTCVQVDGGAWIWNRQSDTDGNLTTWTDAAKQTVGDMEAFKSLVAGVDDDTDLSTLPELQSVNTTFYDLQNRRFLKEHNIYGGGYNACATDSAVILLNHSPLMTIDDGNGTDINLLDLTTQGGLCLYLSMLETSYPQFSVFGAGYGEHTSVANTRVMARPGLALNTEDNEPDYTQLYRAYATDLAAYEQFEEELQSDYAQVSSNDRRVIYGNLTGDDSDAPTYLRYRAARLAWSMGIPGLTYMNILGGGYSGRVTGNTDISTDRQLMCRNLFGGGLGARPESIAEGQSYDYGTVGGNTAVNVISGTVACDVFGGGAGVESYRYADGGTYTDFRDMARVNGTTTVNIGGATNDGTTTDAYSSMNRTLIFGSVYGGGDVANVGPATADADALVIAVDADADASYRSTVNIKGGTLFSQVFAGGNGRLNAECGDYKMLGAINGNARIVITDNADVLNRIYGGCKNGTVYGNSLVDIHGGQLSYNVFGGGWGDVADDGTVTSADVTGNTNIHIIGGEFKLTSYWLPDERAWEPATVVSGTTYSPQFDAEAQKYKINHNIYGGGNVACQVRGNSYVTMTHGLLAKSTDSGTNSGANFFESTEWQASFKKVGTPHFAIFGGGYGEHTDVANTEVNVSCEHKKEDEIGDYDSNASYAHFISNQAVMDIVGGGFSGTVSGRAHVTLGDGTTSCKTFARRVFGGGFYNSVGTSVVDARTIDCQDIYGGGLMGDVIRATNVNIGQEGAEANANIYVHGNIYGGNDVSGYINLTDQSADGDDVEFVDNEKTDPADALPSGIKGYRNGTHVSVYGGRIYGNVYGAGNGDYLYALGKNGETEVTINEDYTMAGNSNVYDLVYTVPMRSTMASAQSASPAMTIVNINSWRPLTNKVTITLSGSVLSPVNIEGNVFGGGNSATVMTAKTEQESTETVGGVCFNIKDYLNVGGIYLGSDGDQLFVNAAENPFLKDFQDINSLSLHDTVDWANDPANHGISTAYLPTAHDERPEVYPHLLDLYFQPVEMAVQPRVYWNGSETGDVTDVTIGTFCCGGNRGNMNVEPDNDGNVIDITFPRSLVITDKIVGGCNRANYIYEEYSNKTTHVGGYLLGERRPAGSEKDPLIRLTVLNRFAPSVKGEGGSAYYSGANVYGGCYETGTIKGDVSIDFRSDMLTGLETSKLDAANDAGEAACNVYGAGYGTSSYVRGNIEIFFGSNKSLSGVSAADAVAESDNTQPASANFVFGGGQQGNVVGNTTLHILNGQVYKSVTGGSYAGYQWGSTQVMVGYPSYYVANADGVYTLKRADTAEDNLALKNSDETNYEDESAQEYTVKRSVHLLKGDIVSAQVVDAIKAYDTDNATAQADNFTKTTQSPADYNWSWNKVNITIGEAVYGGGYSLATGSSVLANNTTVLKYTDSYNIDDSFAAADLAALGNHTTAGYGGNTTMLIADDNTDADTDADKEHLSISRQEMKEVTTLTAGTDLYGYYYKDKDGNYRYINTGGTYAYGTNYPSDADDTKKIYEYDSEGGIFGDGHLSYAQGFRNAELTGYGYAKHSPRSAKILNTFQRLDMLRLTDNCLVLLGARDYATNATNKTPYSIARVGEIQMKSTIDASAALGTDKTASRTRNYMGLSNNIHYLGAMTSDVAFTDLWHDSKNGAVGESDSYLTYKKKYLPATDENDQNTNFQQRNDGTARNMMGIASGYALKLQNVQECYDAEKNTIVDKLYYGPIIGVVEMYLIDANEDEGGGYVYADNVHADGTFMETTGNFVFPYGETQYIIDDCFPTSYLDLKSQSAPMTRAAEADGTELPEIHYWYVTGFNYYYNVHITGYTYKNSAANPNVFDSDNSDGLTVLTGLKEGQQVEIYQWKLRSGHSEDYSCDLESNCSAGYTLKVACNGNKTYDEEEVHYTLPMDGTVEAKTEMNGQLGALTSGDAKINFRLTDCVDNSKSAYYKEHLQEPCYATLILRAPSLNSDNKPEKTYISIQDYYTYDEKTGTYTAVTEGALEDSKQYYYRLDAHGTYEKIVATKMFDKNSDGDYVRINKLSDIIISAEEASKKYFFLTERYFYYTVYLTIEYAQGPDVSGNITIGNCALPGEMIKLSSEEVNISVDQSMSPNAYYWRIGPDLTNESEWLYTTEQVKQATETPTYDTYRVGDNTTKNGVFADCIFNETENALYIPAYYYMNGYCVQYGFTVNGLDNSFFTAPMQTVTEITPAGEKKSVVTDTLLVHNFHRMDPHSGTKTVNLHLRDAIKRAEAGSLAEPRIYLMDETDLTAFGTFLDTIGNNGAGASFFLSEDLAIPADYVPSTHDFAGTLHGDGHLLSGLATGKSLFKENRGRVYNLGMVSGKIADTNNTENGGAYYCSFEYNDGTSTKKVYLTDGMAHTDYDADDFRYGRAAYDLNGYYKLMFAGETEAPALEYVRDYYANGDYQYARRGDALTKLTTGIEYLRTGTNDIPGYSTTSTNHDTSHAIDKARAQGYVAAETAEDGTVTAESRTGVYLPLYNAASQTEGLDLDETMNDYLFWGQSLQAVPADYPSAIDSRQVSVMTNRVWCVAGYYGTTVPAGFYYNAYKQDTRVMGTYVHRPTTTAVDFTSRNAAAYKDVAASYSSFNLADGVTRNLLVYTQPSTDLDDEAYAVVESTLGYTEDTREANIRGHHLVAASSSTMSTELFHLVERASTADANNDLCVPIAFSVTDRAWYTRQPSHYAESVNSAWEGICLPFTANRVEASANGLITHFYGEQTDADKADPNSDCHSLHHEYWLRGFSAVTAGTDANGNKVGAFRRPGLFTDDKQSAAVIGSYAFSNSFFEDTFGEDYADNVSDDTQSWYSTPHTYGDYLPLTAEVPYLVSFPGARFYEFDLSGSFYEDLYGSVQPQSITYSAYGPGRSDVENAAPAINVPVTTAMQTTVSSDGTDYSHVGTFCATPATWTLNAAGTAFARASATVLPFRTYMTTATATASAPRLTTIIIGGETTDLRDLDEDAPGEDEAGDTAPGLRVYASGSGRITVVSTYDTTLMVYTTAGQLCRTLDVRQGLQIYSGFRPGIYLVASKKIRVQ